MINSFELSKATNSYGLLVDVIKVIREEPKRMWMGLFHIPATDLVFYGIKSTGPACGTVGCIGGWIENLRGFGRPGAVPGLYERILMFPPNELIQANLQNLFFGEDPFAPFPGDALYGTTEYVDHVVQQIEHFMSMHETELKAFQLPTLEVQ